MRIKKIPALARDNIITIAAYCATLYYFEIIRIMFVLALLFGRFPAIAAGLGLSALLALHIILLNSGKNMSRIIHLCIMDLHAALTVSSVASFLLLGSEANWVNMIQIAVRVTIFIIEIPLIFTLTDILIIGRFKNESAT